MKDGSSRGEEMQQSLRVMILLAPAAAAVLFLFLMMQVSAITVPFWDHWDSAPFIIKYYDEGLRSALEYIFTTAHNSARPVVFRLIILGNAILTRWDVGSEFIYMYAAWAALAFLHYRLARKLSGTPHVTLWEAAILSIIAILLCTPAANNNHWWSFMLTLVQANVFAFLALSTMSFSPRKWLVNIAAAILCWLSIYSMTNGLALIASVAIVSQFSSAKPIKADRFTLFWVANLVMVYLIYFPIPEAINVKPSLFDLTRFVILYIGQPLASLFVPFRTLWIFDPIPGQIKIAYACGAAILIFAAWIIVAYRDSLRQPTPQFLVFLGFGLFSLFSAGITGWGRITIDEKGISNALNGRYILFGSYAAFAIIYFILAERQNLVKRLSFGAIPDDSVHIARLCIPVYAIFLAFAVRAYTVSIPIYKEAGEFNRHLYAGFSYDGLPTTRDASLFPNESRLIMLRSSLARLKIGPYRVERAPH